MKCAPADLYFLFELPYLTLARQQTAISFLSHQIERADALSHVLSAYPIIKYEPLDFYYRLHQCLSIIDQDVIADLMSNPVWQGKIIGAFLCFLESDSKYESLLLNAIQHTPKINQWLLYLALSEINPQYKTEHFSKEAEICFKKLKQNLIPIKSKKSIRKLSYDNLNNIEQEQKLLLAKIYHSQGVHAAYQFIKNSDFYTLFHRPLA